VKLKLHPIASQFFGALTSRQQSGLRGYVPK